MIDTNQTVASIVLDHSECAPVLQRNRIDFCCRGEMTLEAACSERGLEVGALIADLEQAIAERNGTRDADPRELSTPTLIAHIVGTHHEYLRKSLPFVLGLAAKVARVHGEHNPKLVDLDSAVAGIAEAILPHLDSEEQELFPEMMVRSPNLPRLAAQVQAMRDEHLIVGELLGRMREASEDFSVPDWACNSYRTLFSELEQLEADILSHVHLENHVLAPRFTGAGALELEAQG